MNRTPFPRARPVPLIAVAHGSRDPRAAATVEDLLDLVREARPGLPVRAAYLDHAPPTLAGVLAGQAEAAVLPLLLTEAYHSRVDIPGALAEAAARQPRLRVHRGATLGPHPLLTTALERRLAEAGVAAGDPETAVVLVSAGSSDHRANATVARIARDWARRGWWAATAAYASAAAPAPEAEVRRLLAAGAPRVVVAPYLLAPGHFADRIRANTLAAGAETVADVLGAAPEVASVLLERYGQALGRTEVSATA
ncbi:cobalamin biosynthesis protein CbiX [Planomonospora sphaerica]|uniref:Cobalamin biosynthesis protein CbiX n=1 Tax=Planomonospora sphaerica TaxID=161355 RepID=A0A171C410_9ACTN|nr:sirohydrochlorin chelatase [Planomonospora sphaerica]GAT66072.1 cobalamin biosynthesis protein CbiX [Planomonospora sphaerica]